MKVRVVCYEGYKAVGDLRAFLLGERRIEVVRVLDRWRGEDHEYVKLDGSDGARLSSGMTVPGTNGRSR